MRYINKRVLLFVVVSLTLTTISVPSYAQVDIGVMERSLRAIQARFDNLNEKIDQLTWQLFTLLQEDIDKQLRDELSEDLRELNSISDCLNNKNKLYESEDRFKDLNKRIREEIASYYDRLAINNDYSHGATSPLKEWTGTGFALNDGYIVTNNHIAENAKSIEVYGINGEYSSPCRAKVIGLDKNNDLALLKIEDPSFGGFGNVPYSIKTSNADVGEDVFVLGYPLITVMGDEIKLTTGVLSSRTGYQGDVSSYQISAPIQPGNSGGPLFDSKGNVIGIVNAKITAADNVGYAIKSTYLRNLVESYTTSSILPNVNSVASLTRPNQVKKIKNYIFLIKCSNKASKASYSSPTISKSSSLPTSPYSSASQSIRTVTSKDVSLKVGEQVQLKADGKTITKWETDDESIVQVNKSGLITGVREGRTIIWAHLNNGELQFFNITVSVLTGTYTSNRVTYITGTVRSRRTNAPIFGAVVRVQGTYIAAKTSSSGRYSIRASEGDVLVFTDDHHYSITRAVGDHHIIDVNMTHK